MLMCLSRPDLESTCYSVKMGTDLNSSRYMNCGGLHPLQINLDQSLLEHIYAGGWPIYRYRPAGGIWYTTAEPLASLGSELIWSSNMRFAARMLNLR